MPVKPAENGKAAEKVVVRLGIMFTSLVSSVVRRAKAACPRVGIIVCDELLAKNCYVNEIAATCAVEMLLRVLQLLCRIQGSV